MIDAVILCGGKGTRVKHIHPDLPKVLFPICGRPFLDFVLENLYKEGYRRFILATGYLSNKVEEYAINSKYEKYIVISRESKPLGTAGAIKNTEKYVKTDDFLVLNGDSLTSGISGLMEFHIDYKNLATIAIVDPHGRKDGGNININENFLVTDFNEKSGKGEYMNAGIYLFQKDIFSLIPEEDCSLEKDILPKLVDFDFLYGFLIKNKVIDIGTEERYVNFSK